MLTADRLKALMLPIRTSRNLWALLFIPAMELASSSSIDAEAAAQSLHYRAARSALTPDASTAKRTVKQALLLLSLGCFILAGANPGLARDLKR